LVCFQGRDLGRGGGRLCLIQVGVKGKIYLLDILTLGKALDYIQAVFESDAVDKFMWDGRHGVAELWHGHGISMKSGIDLQLVHVYEKTFGRSSWRGVLPAESLESAFLNLDVSVHEDTGIDWAAFNRSNFTS
jgi:hypothetical protein